MSSPLSSIVWFCAIVAAIPLVLWLLKRTPLGGAAGAGAGMKSVGMLPLSASQRIVTVEVGHGSEKRWLVLGVTAQAITTLHTMAPGEPLPGPLEVHVATAPIVPNGVPTFQSLLARWRARTGAADVR